VTSVSAALRTENTGLDALTVEADVPGSLVVEHLARGVVDLGLHREAPIAFGPEVVDGHLPVVVTHRSRAGLVGLLGAEVRACLIAVVVVQRHNSVRPSPC